MEFQQFQLRKIINAHASDVRSIRGLQDREGFVSGSRDKLIKLYESDNNNVIAEKQCFHGPNHYVSCVYIHRRPNDGKHLIYAGSNDSKIYVFDPSANNGEPIVVLAVHDSTVCNLDGNDALDVIVSGSWDSKAIIWKSNQQLAKLSDHQATVWAVCIFSDSIILTGSADHTIKAWQWSSKSADVSCLSTLKQHKDVVRAIKRLTNDQFLSCSNDATILLWNISGECLATYYGHENYIYDLAVLNSTPGNFEFVTCSEDKTVRVWKNGSNTQAIKLPVGTVWALDGLLNGDIAIGASNGKIFVFTRHKQLLADEVERLYFEEELSKSKLPVSEFGDIDPKKLPGTEALMQPGKVGQTKLIKEGNLIIAYQWEEAQSQWKKIGEVVGQAKSGHDPSQKKSLDGKLYDFVFNVDIEDGKPPLKLPYNLDQSPYDAAQAFIHQNDLPQVYLDQIANFIIKNSSTPGASAAPAITGANYDPLTGGSSYSTSSTGYTCESNEDYPVTKYWYFKNLNIEGITKKLIEFSEQLEEPFIKLTDVEIKILLKLVEPNNRPTDEQLRLLREILKWPKEKIFPGLDIVKSALLVPHFNSVFCCSPESGQFIMSLIEKAYDGSIAANQLLSLRCLCNLFGQHDGLNLIARYLPSLWELIERLVKEQNKNVQIAVATMYLNFTVFYARRPADNESKTDLIFKIFSMFKTPLDSEALYRLMIAIGTMCATNRDIKLIINQNDIRGLMKKQEGNMQEKRISRCLNYLLELTR